MSLIDKFEDDPSPVINTPEQKKALEQLLQQSEMCLTYSDEEAWLASNNYKTRVTTTISRLQGEGEDLTSRYHSLAGVHKKLHLHLKEKFGEQLFVDRIEADDIVNRINIVGTPAPLQLVGHTGSGKSTIMRSAASQDQAKEVLFIDMQRHLAEFEDMQAQGTLNEQEIITRILIRRMKDTYIWGAEDQEVLNSWYAYLIDNHTLFESFLDCLAVGGVRLDGSSNYIKSINKYPELMSGFYKEIKNLDNFPPSELCKCLFQFIRLYWDKEIALYIDNIDRFSLATQVAIKQKAQNWCQEGLCTPVIAIRIGNENRVSKQLGARAINDKSIHCRTKKKLIQACIDRRLQFFKEYIFANETEQRDFVTRLVEISLLLLKKKEASTYIRDVVRWQNDSIRRASWFVQEFFVRISSGFDIDKKLLKELYNKGRDINHYSHGGQIIRRLRNAFFRHLIFGLHGVTEDAPQLEPLVREISSEPGESNKVFGMPVRIIEHLQMRHGNTTYENLAKEFSRIGVHKTVTFEALRHLHTPLRSESTSSILIDIPRDQVNENMRKDTELSILPRGKFLYECLTCSCEFLFWSAMHSELSSDVEKKVWNAAELYEVTKSRAVYDVLGGKRSNRNTNLNVNILRNDSLRSIVAASFVENVLLKNQIKEFELLKNHQDKIRIVYETGLALDAADREEYRHGAGGIQNTFIKRCCVQIGRFVKYEKHTPITDIARDIVGAKLLRIENALEKKLASLESV